MRLHNALVTLLLTLSCAERIDARQRLRVRQENNNAPATTNAPTSTVTSGEHPSSTASPAPTSTGNGASHTSLAPSSASNDPATSPITTGTITDLTSSTSTALPGINSTTADGELPLQPALNPALGVAGVILMLSGVGLGFIGIKHKGTQTFLSTALLVALGIEVLIIYLMHPPVPAGVQGAYLVAGVCGGALLGGLSLIFKEVCEGFGCVLGGFCFAMWLMVLTPGGTIKNNTGMIILIAVFCVAGYCAYISRFTRGYAVIFCTAFAGSTAFVLGIDCFSQAGLKEFWLYIWDLNPNEFPLFTDTYPITRPMRAEIAAIIIVAFLGVMSQIKIWKIVKEQKAKRDAQRIQDEEARNIEEEEVGRDIESRNRRSLDHWEGHYDDKKQPSVNVDSGFASLEDITEEHEHSSYQEHNSYPLVNVSSSSRDGKKVDKRLSSSSLNIFRHSLAPSLPPLGFGAEDNAEDTKAILHEDEASTHAPPTTAGSELPSPRARPVSTVKDRRGLNLKRLSIRSLRSKDVPGQSPVPSPAPETPWIEEDDDVASSIAATAAEPPDVDALSVRLSRPNSMYLSLGTPSAMPSRESIVEFDPEALNLARTSTHGGLSPRLEVPKSPGTPGEASASGSYFGDKAEKSDEKVELADRLPKKLSKVALNYRTNEWAKAISAAEPEPIEENLVHDPEAVQVEMGDAAESARAKQNNAAPAPPPPPPAPPAEPKENKEVKTERRKSLGNKRMSTGPLTPIYAHASKPSDDSWSVPLAKRTSSNPVLTVDAPPAEAQRNVSAPVLEQPIVASPVDNSMMQSRPGSAIRSVDPRMSRTNSQQQARPDSRMQRSASQLQVRAVTPNNLMDERRERMETRLTTTSFMAPLVEGAPIVSEPTSAIDSSQGDFSEQQNKSSNTSANGEEMTLAERKALVQRESTTIQQPIESYQPPSRRPSTQQGQRQVTPTRPPSRPARMSSTGPAQPLYDSHQPRRASSHNANKAAANWSQWRSSNAIAATQQPAIMHTNTQIDMMRAQRAQTELEAREKEKRERKRQESMDVAMRMGGMNGAHRAALARMQGEVNKRQESS